MKRVLVLTPWIGRSGGGVSEAARLFTNALVQDGDIEVEVLAFEEESFEQDKQAWPDVPIKSFKSYGPSNYKFSPGMLSYVLSRKADAIHVHGIWMFHVFAAYLWCLLKGKKALVTPHGMLEKWIMERSSKLKKAVSTLYQHRFLKNSVLQVLTEKERQDVVDAGLPAKNCVVIPNYVNPPRSDLGPAKWWHPSYSKRRVYMYFGRIHDKKGWRELCEAWGQLSAKNKEFRDQSLLVFCGWPDSCPEFEPTVQDLNDRFGNIIYAGSQYGDERDQSYSSADVFLLPSKSEGLPMAILEAWSAGLPTIMTEACNLNIGFEAGASIKTTEDTAGIVEALKKVQQLDEAGLEKFKLAALSTIDKYFSKTYVSSSYVQTVKGLFNV